MNKNWAVFVAGVVTGLVAGRIYEGGYIHTACGWMADQLDPDPN